MEDSRIPTAYHLQFLYTYVITTFNEIPIIILIHVLDDKLPEGSNCHPAKVAIIQARLSVIRQRLIISCS